MQATAWAAILLIICAPSLDAQARPDEPADAGRVRAVAPAIAGGVAGSALGMLAGAALAGQTVDCSRPHAGTEFCGLGEGIIGALVGSTVGSATGAYLGARLGGGRPSAVRTAVAAVGGVAGGLVLGMLVDSVVDADVSGFVAFTIGQGTLSGLAAALWH